MDGINYDFDACVQVLWDNPSKLEKMVKKDRNILKLRGLHAESLLHFFVVESKVDAVKILLKLGSDPNCSNRLGTTALGDAATLGNCAVIKLLIDHGAIVNQRNKYGSTALHCAAEFRRRDAYSLLLKAGADERIINMFGETPLSLLEEHS